jgi:hypothetical protein
LYARMPHQAVGACIGGIDHGTARTCHFRLG